MTAQDIEATEYAAEWGHWHKQHTDRLAAPDGFLAITSINWLSQTPQRFTDAPGSWAADDSGVSVLLDDGETLELDGTVIRGSYHFGRIPSAAACSPATPTACTRWLGGAATTSCARGTRTTGCAPSSGVLPRTPLTRAGLSRAATGRSRRQGTRRSARWSRGSCTCTPRPARWRSRWTGSRWHSPPSTALPTAACTSCSPTRPAALRRTRRTGRCTSPRRTPAAPWSWTSTGRPASVRVHGLRYLPAAPGGEPPAHRGRGGRAAALRDRLSPGATA